MSTVTALNDSLTRKEMLQWVKDALVEMPECAFEPHFLTWSTELTQPMFEFLYERVRTEGIRMHKSHMTFRPEDTPRDFIAQIDTAD